LTNSFWYHFTGIALFCLFLLPMVFPQYDTIRRLLGEPFRWRQLAQCTLMLCGSWCTNRLVILYLNGWIVFFAIAWYALIVLLVFRKRGWEFLINNLKMVLTLFSLELLCALIIALAGWLGYDTAQLVVVTLEDMHDLPRLLCYSLVNLLAALLIWGTVILFQYFRYLHRTAPPMLRKRRWHIVFSVVRLTVISTAATSLLTMPHYLFGVKSLSEMLLPNHRGYILLSLSVVLMLAVALSYLFQDINYLVQSQRLNTLEQQQRISRSLLQNLRFFRHNVINMLYGLEGAMLSDDGEKTAAYFNEIKEKCALVNNENISALEKITNPSLSALMLHAIDKARMVQLPINLYVQDGLVFPYVLGDADLCQLVGVLVDNALEAANDASERYVMLELRNVENALELIVSNTYTGTVTIEQLSRGGVSTKEGHPGHGLASCYHILSRKRNVHLNFWVTGQYVRAQLLLHR
jgi:sensor histidine kinase YesM